MVKPLSAGCVNTVVACRILITSDYVSQVAHRKLTHIPHIRKTDLVIVHSFCVLIPEEGFSNNHRSVIVIHKVDNSCVEVFATTSMLTYTT